jgi:hypothetical protein
MNYTTLIQLALLISCAALGFRAITSSGMILYFLRKPFDKLEDRKKEIIKKEKSVKQRRNTVEGEIKLRTRSNSIHGANNQERTKLHDLYVELESLEDPDKYNWILYIAKPLITCSTCMASVHTLIWYPIFNGWDWFIIPMMLIVAFTNSVMFGFYESLK